MEYGRYTGEHEMLPTNERMITDDEIAEFEAVLAMEKYTGGRWGWLRDNGASVVAAVVAGTLIGHSVLELSWSAAFVISLLWPVLGYAAMWGVDRWWVREAEGS